VLNLPLGVDTGTAPRLLLMPDMMPKHPAVNARYKRSRNSKRMAVHSYLEKQTLWNRIELHIAKTWSEESPLLSHLPTLTKSVFKILFILKYKFSALSVDLPGSSCGCST